MKDTVRDEKKAFHETHENVLKWKEEWDKLEHEMDALEKGIL